MIRKRKRLTASGNPDRTQVYLSRPNERFKLGETVMPTNSAAVAMKGRVVGHAGSDRVFVDWSFGVISQEDTDTVMPIRDHVLVAGATEEYDEASGDEAAEARIGGLLYDIADLKRHTPAQIMGSPIYSRKLVSAATRTAELSEPKLTQLWNEALDSIVSGREAGLTDNLVNLGKKLGAKKVALMWSKFLVRAARWFDKQDTTEETEKTAQWLDSLERNKFFSVLGDLVGSDSKLEWLWMKWSEWMDKESTDVPSSSQLPNQQKPPVRRFVKPQAPVKKKTL